MSNPANPYMEPIPQKTTVALINLVVVRFSDFLNKFYVETEDKLLQLEKRIETLDTVLQLLEKKLDSIPPELFNAKPVASYNNPEVHSAPQASDQSGAVQEQQQQQQQAGGGGEAQPQPAVAPEDDPEREQYVRYIKMFKMGVPLMAIKLKMNAEGVENPDGLEKYIDLDAAPH